MRGFFVRKFKHGGRKGQGLVHVAALLAGLLIFYIRTCFKLILNGSELVARLVACGFTEPTARDTCEKYAAEGDFSGLERFIRQNELLYDDRKQYV